MEVPELERNSQVSFVLPSACAAADMIPEPGVVMSGLILPSNEGPLELK